MDIGNVGIPTVDAELGNIDIPIVKGDKGDTGLQGPIGVGISNISIVGTTMTITYTNGTSQTVTLQTATQSSAGMMSATDKTKLDGADDTYAKRSIYGDTTINVGRKANTTVGQNSTAEGTDTTASGNNSHAEGWGTTASSSHSHAEGMGSSATGICAHAEGGSVASGINSHAEGSNTKAQSGGAHAEGDSTTASGMASHSEGTYTTANTKSQHVFGEYNVLDTEGSATTRGEFVEIVGNGTSSARSNARTLDWEGNEVLAGDLTTGNGNSVDTIASSISGKQDTLTAGSNITISSNVISATDTTYSEATTSTAGLMSASDKTTINGLGSTYALITESGAIIDLAIDSSTYVLTASLKDKNGNVIDTSEGIDLPLESMVVGASYSDGNITLTLQNGTTTTFSVSALIYGLEDTTNKVTSLSSLSTDTQYPSAKCVYDNLDSLYEVLGLDTDNYNASTTYTTNQIVVYSHKLYKAIQETTGNLPTNTAYWEETSILV